MVSIKSIIFYIILISIIALISLAIILNFVVQTAERSEVVVEFYIGGEKIDKIICTKVDANNNSYYDCENNPCILDVFVYKDGETAKNVWVILDGCGIKSSQKTNEKGYASFSLKGLYLPSGISKDKLTVKVLSHEFYIDVVRG